MRGLLQTPGILHSDRSNGGVVAHVSSWQLSRPEMGCFGSWWGFKICDADWTGYRKR